MSAPVFAVVGHPNKGKSSIVSTLARDDRVAIGPEPGTTTICRRYPMRMGDEVLYELVDTPGFQRARAALAWMRERETTADQRPEVVRAFAATHAAGDAFPDEVELLKPLVEGAGLLYVVDGSVPYGPEYEAEMAILRWTGCPRMGLINPIGGTAHVDAWRTALDQYFGIVRVFNALHSDVHRRVELLRAFGELREDWRPHLERAARDLERERDRRRAQSARTLAETMHRMLSLRIDIACPEETTIDDKRDAQSLRYQQEMRRFEDLSRDRIEQIYDLRFLQRNDSISTDLAGEDLFSETTWRVFGLSRRQLFTLGAIGGATAGGAIDIATAGHSMLIGTLLGGVVGATSILVAGQSLAQIRVLNQPLGGRRLVIGPIQSVNFPFVVLGRARLHHALIANRSHAQRDPLVLAQGLLESLPPIGAAHRRSLGSLFRKLRDSRQSDQAREHLADLLDVILASGSEF